MEYAVGDRFVYPMHGAGVVSDIEEKEVLGDLRKYYHLTLPYGNLQLLVPVDNAEDLGIRDVISSEEFLAVLRVLESPCCDGSQNWNKRHRENLDKLRSGDILEVAEVYKFLIFRDKEKKLSTGEKKMLSSAKNILFSELLLSSGKEIYEIEELVRQAIARNGEQE